jgi:diguanylate cyclase
MHQGLSINLSLSIGVYTLIPDAGSDREQLLRRADQALYQAKAAGRNKVIGYEASALDDV